MQTIEGTSADHAPTDVLSPDDPALSSLYASSILGRAAIAASRWARALVLAIAGDFTGVSRLFVNNIQTGLDKNGDGDFLDASDSKNGVGWIWTFSGVSDGTFSADHHLWSIVQSTAELRRSTN